MHEQALADTAAEQEELNRIKQEVSDFKAKLLSIYREHLTMIGVLEDYQPSEAEEPQETAAIEDQPKEEVTPVRVERPSVEPHNVPDFSAFELKA